MDDKGSFDYTSEMKKYYESDEVATDYYAAYTEEGNWRHKLIANRERGAIEKMLQAVPHDTVLDIPAGTGKLAPVFGRLDSNVVACDISENMLQIAKSEFNDAGVTDARFQICDAEEITETIDETFDVAVSLRLFHRVPTDVKRNILSELGSVADYVIVSTAVETRFHVFRRAVRQSIFGGDERGHCYETPEVTKDIFSDGFEIISWKRVLPVLSQERVYLLEQTH